MLAEGVGERSLVGLRRGSKIGGVTVGYKEK